MLFRSEGIRGDVCTGQPAPRLGGSALGGNPRTPPPHPSPLPIPGAPDLVVRFLLHVEPIHLHDSIPSAQPRRFGGGTGLHFADELPALALLAVQVEAVAVLPFQHMAQPRFQLVLSHGRGGRRSAAERSGAERGRAAAGPFYARRGAGAGRRGAEGRARAGAAVGAGVGVGALRSAAILRAARERGERGGDGAGDGDGRGGAGDGDGDGAGGAGNGADGSGGVPGAGGEGMPAERGCRAGWIGAALGCSERSRSGPCGARRAGPPRALLRLPRSPWGRSEPPGPEGAGIPRRYRSSARARP